jgi:hypothetical protein
VFYVDMIIKAKHKHVDANGVIYLPYLHDWSPQRSNLTDLIGGLRRVFSLDPPLFSKASLPQTTQINPTPTTSLSSFSQSNNTSAQQGMGNKTPQPSIYSGGIVSGSIVSPPLAYGGATIASSGAGVGATSGAVFSQSSSGFTNTQTSTPAMNFSSPGTNIADIYNAQNEQARLYSEVTQKLTDKILGYYTKFRGVKNQSYDTVSHSNVLIYR